MAAEIPVKDVLCEAMEYLSKLGSNLRTRSENLKEKKINKVKLTNALAVQKAADKVLLICQLSKKSLANVEAGVRKVLEHIDVSQATSSVGGKRSYSKNEKKIDDKPNYHYFDYKSRKLKIRTKISLKHYKSVKVHARKMTMSMLEKYSVYYDCALYRLRRQKDKLAKTTKDKTMNITAPVDIDIVGSDIDEAAKEKQVLVSKENKTSGSESDVSLKSTCDNKHQDELDSDKISKNRRSSEMPERKLSKQSDKNESTDNEHEEADKSNKIKKSRADSSEENESTYNKHEETDKSNKRKKSRADSSEESESTDNKHEETDKSNKRNKSRADSSDENESNDNEHEETDKSNKRKKARVDSSEESYYEEKDHSKSDPKKRKIDKSEHKEDDDVISLNSDDDTVRNSKDNPESNTIKPIIKCVSISKLLKPDILEKNTDKQLVANKNSKTLIGKKVKFDVGKKNKMLQERISQKKDREEEFWADKRREVSTFKPKQFCITIFRLPTLCPDFLIKNNLRKIIKEGDTVCDVSEEKNDSSVDETKLSSERSSKQKINQTLNISAGGSTDELISAQTKKVKNSLLNESDSENDLNNTSKNQEKLSETTVDRVKNALLHSDSDENNDITTEAHKEDEDDKILKKVPRHKIIDSDDSKESKDSTSAQAQKDEDKPASDVEISDNENNAVKSSDSDNQSEKSDKSPGKVCEKKINKSESDDLSDSQRPKTPEKDSSPARDDNAEKSHDSSDDKTNTPLSKRRESTPRSKKKRIRESAKAKNELLRYSSGSETEDVESRVALDNIKKSLLEGISDEENKLLTPDLLGQRRSSKESNSSIENIIRVKNKKSRRDSTSRSSKKTHSKKKRLNRISDSEESNKNESSDEEKSTTSSRKMVRSKAKPGNCSSHSSDAQDPNDKDIDGLTNLRTLNKPSRRNSEATETTQRSNSTGRSRMAKKTGLIAEEILKSESSDEGSTGEVEALDEEEDLPSVSLTGLNGAMDHLVKEDLLGDSDSSVSVKGDKKEEEEISDEEEKLKAKRRKAANAISSDSETGVALKKSQRKGNAISSDSETSAARKRVDDEDVKLSDFEDSDDSELTKRSKRKKKGSDSDGSVNSDGGKKKRRRIKSLDDSDGSGSDSENDGRKHGRKNIRKVMGKDQLEEATKRAARQEKERVARIAERQKIYNNLQFDESGKPDEVVLDKVILDFDPETKEPIIAVDRGLVKKLKPHQANGIKFMWDACFESVKRIKKDKGSGCILAHCMGLGKTLQVVALTHTLLAHDDLTKVHRVLVVCPLSTVLNWVNEFKMWLKYADSESDIEVYELSRFKQNGERAFQLSQWFQHGGVCVLGYEMFRNLSADNNKKFKKKMLKNFQESLVDPGPDLVVCDEGHLLKNEKTSLSQSMNRVRTLRRIVLTGTPLQNNLKEYYCMVQFVKPNLLGKYNEYLNRFVNPITNGQYTDSTDHDIRIMKRRSHVLHKMLDGAVQRRDYGVLAPFLPPKHEYVLFITLSEVQVNLYQHYLENYSRRPQPGKSSGFLFPDFQSLQRIWTHPLVLKYNSERYEIQQQKKRDKEEEEDSEGSLIDFIDDDSTPDESSAEESFDNSSDCSDDSRKKSKKKKANKKSKGKDKDKESTVASRRRGTRANPIELDDDEVKIEEDILEVKYENPTEWWIKMVEEDKLEDMRNSHKLVLLFDILRQCEAIGDKLLVFSQSLYSLDLIEHFLRKVDDATQDGRIDEKLGGHVGSWSPGLDYFRLDGSTSCENRSIWCKSFNRVDNQRARLFLISTRAGGLGINLVAANRVVIFDVSWNPSHDVQSIFRVYRFGQKKPCYVYRFLAMGTMEEKIYERQVTKQAISKRVIDEQQIDRHYAENDLAELYKFEPQPPTPRPLPPLPKDRLFAEMLREHEAQIYKYHEHDSLLENKEEETLSEEERKAAWEDFENEKNRPPPAPFVSPWPMHNGMVPNLMVQQQQQLAYAALASMLRKDMPTINDNQIRDMLPMIYNANPAMFGGYDYGLMQKMSEIYKYSQMTPSMMASSMNSASSGVAMGAMSSNSLRYEPPWQRQQQQQQQMRLQQLMQQQQNQMGAKLYAGGLGSRDPVAMALQQQRAREIMMGGGAGRPRGRPPLQPRAPPAAQPAAPPGQDVVNLDSD